MAINYAVTCYNIQFCFHCGRPFIHSTTCTQSTTLQSVTDQANCLITPLYPFK